MSHLLCSACHHEWDMTRDNRICDWCGAIGRPAPNYSTPTGPDRPRVPKLILVTVAVDPPGSWRVGCGGWRYFRGFVTMLPDADGHYRLTGKEVEQLTGEMPPHSRYMVL
jgi:hypothetical protein